MGNPHPRQSGSTVAVIAVVAIMVLITLFGLLVVGGGMLFYVRARTSEAEQKAMIAREHAERARQLAELARVEAERQATVDSEPRRQAKEAAAAAGRGHTHSTPRVEQDAGSPELTLSVDQNGRVVDKGRVLGLQEFNRLIAPAPTEDRRAVSVLLRVDERCPASRIVPVLEQLLEAGVTAIQLQILKGDDAPAGAAESASE